MSQKALRSAWAEKTIMESLDHENVMKLLDSYEDDEHLYLVMDLMVEDLRNIVINNNKPLKEKFIRKIFT